MTLVAGSRLGPYEIVAPLGAGGMGEVWRGRDTRLGREVAIKVLPVEVATDPERRRRFELEARAVSTLNHPGIVTLYEIETASGPAGPIEFLALELVPGAPLHERIPTGGLPIAEAVELALQMADALAAAHAAGVVHRDLKPANLMVTPSGRLKVLDFGLARLQPTGRSDPHAPTFAESTLTRAGSVLGTFGYLAPEQAAGERVDARADLFAFGVVFYEMLTGRCPFARDTPLRSLTAVLHEPAAPLAGLRADVPARLRELVERCLEKDPGRRPASAEAVASDLRALRDGLAPARPAAGRARHLGLGAAAATLILGAAGALLWWRGADERWLTREAMPGIERRLAADQRFLAFRLGLEARRRSPADARLERLLERFTLSARIESEPAGATVEVADYLDPSTGWVTLGTTPIGGARIPDSALRFRVRLAGYMPVESAPIGIAGTTEQIRHTFLLTPEASTPPGMVRVGGGVSSDRLREPVPVESFWLDRFEVTNAEFQRFVDDGGYRRRELWQEAFRERGRELSWQEAMRRFLDSTGRPGPSTWELGRFPAGADALPVGGVSWFEAAAYARWAGKSLPTLHHWYRAASPDIFSEIIELSNFGSTGPRPVGSRPDVGPWGTFDMAGNVKEWTSTASGDRRFQLGGGWSDPGYLYTEPEQADPWQRDPMFGFRCARFDAPLSPAVTAPAERFVRDFASEKPADDAVFAALTSIYSYDVRAPLDARAEPGGEEADDWKLERLSLAPVAGDERLPLRIFLPRRGRPPFSAVLFFPDSSAETQGVSDRLEYRYFDFLLRSGRAVVFPSFANTYERRRFGWTAGQTQRRRDLVVQWTKEVRRTLDYLATRPDIAADRVAVYGFSLGAVYLPIFTALEPRFAAGISLGGGFPSRPLPPEVDSFQFAPRVRVPMLIIAGREDFVRPLETLQRPLYDRLGTAPDRKRLAVLDGGHLPPRMSEIVREILDWLDRWLGPAEEA